MSGLGHVWTAPWQELSDVSAALVGCGHVSGLLMRRVWPLALMLCADQVPNKNAHFRSRALTQAGSPDPRNDRICITSSCPCQLVLPIYLPARHAASNSFGSLYLSPRTMMAQAIRAILLASATAATFVGRRSINRPSHGRFCVPCLRA
jgi:hypothetical protein